MAATLAKNQLVIFDGASLAGTLTLDRITAPPLTPARRCSSATGPSCYPSTPAARSPQRRERTDSR